MPLPLAPAWPQPSVEPPSLQQISKAPTWVPAAGRGCLDPLTRIQELLPRAGSRKQALGPPLGSASTRLSATQLSSALFQPPGSSSLPLKSLGTGRAATASSTAVPRLQRWHWGEDGTKSPGTDARRGREVPARAWEAVGGAGLSCSCPPCATQLGL